MKRKLYFKIRTVLKKEVDRNYIYQDQNEP